MNMPHCEKSKRRFHATAQRRNVKAQVMGDMAMGRLTVTGLIGFFRSPSLPLTARPNITPTDCTLPCCVSSVKKMHQTFRFFLLKQFISNPSRRFL